MELQRQTVTNGASPTGAESGRYQTTIGRDPLEALRVRSAVRALAGVAGFGDRADDLELVLDELLANAQEHGRPPIDVSAWCNGCLMVEVVDRGPGFDRRAVWDRHPPAPLEHRGRGLWIARQLTDGLSVDSTAEGTRVTIEFCSDPQIGA